MEEVTVPTRKEKRKPPLRVAMQKERQKKVTKTSHFSPFSLLAKKPRLPWLPLSYNFH